MIKTKSLSPLKSVPVWILQENADDYLFWHFTALKIFFYNESTVDDHDDDDDDDDGHPPWIRSRKTWWSFSESIYSRSASSLRFLPRLSKSLPLKTDSSRFVSVEIEASGLKNTFIINSFEFLNDFSLNPRDSLSNTPELWVLNSCFSKIYHNRPM